MLAFLSEQLRRSCALFFLEELLEGSVDVTAPVAAKLLPHTQVFSNKIELFLHKKRNSSLTVLFDIV